MTMAGHRHSAETREKIAAAKRGHRHTAEAREKIAAARRGQRHTAETREKIAAAKRGQTRGPLSVEHRDRLAADERRLIDEAVAAGRVTRIAANVLLCAAVGASGRRCAAAPLPGTSFCERHTKGCSSAQRQRSVFTPCRRLQRQESARSG